jgi:toxin ParE1/3/4
LIRLLVSPQARKDVSELLRWSEAQFGQEAKGRYRRLVQQAYADLRADPDRAGVQSRPDLADSVCFFHVRHSLTRRPQADRVATPRHFIVFRRNGNVLEVLRVLHDAMDIARHL